MNRRQFMKVSAGAGALLLSARRAYPFVQSPTKIRKFAIGLPGLGPGGANEMGNYIPVASPNKAKYPGTDYYEIVMRQFGQMLAS